MPLLGLGTWQSFDGQAASTAATALALGYRHIDTATVYNNEAELGTVLSNLSAFGLTRDSLFLTTKLPPTEMHDPRKALLASLAKLQTPYVDLFLIHWPVAVHLTAGYSGLRPEDVREGVNLEETWREMERLVVDGLAKAVGVSNFPIPTLDRLLRSARLVRPAVNQVESHPYLPQHELLAFCRSRGVHVTAYAPLGSPGRPAHQRVGKDLPSLLEDPVVQAVAQRRHATPAQVLIAFALHRGLSVIPKTSNATRLRENLAAARLVLKDEDMRELLGIRTRVRFLQGRRYWREGQGYRDFWHEEEPLAA